MGGEVSLDGYGIRILTWNHLIRSYCGLGCRISPFTFGWILSWRRWGKPLGTSCWLIRLHPMCFGQRMLAFWLRSTYPRDSLKRLSWPLLLGLGLNFSIMRVSPSIARNATRLATLLPIALLKNLDQRSLLHGRRGFQMITT